MKFQHVYLHDDNAENIKTDTTVSIRNSQESISFVRGCSIGQITNKSNGWLDGELAEALVTASATMCSKIKEEFLKLDSWKPWRAHLDRVKITMASDCIYLTFTRPESVAKIPFTGRQVLQEWPDTINAAQSLFEIGEGHVSHGSPEGGSIQFSYRLKKENK